MNKKPDKKSATRKTQKPSDTTKSAAKQAGLPKEKAGKAAEKAATSKPEGKSRIKAAVKRVAAKIGFGKAAKPETLVKTSTSTEASRAEKTSATNGSPKTNRKTNRVADSRPKEASPLEELTLAIIEPGSSPDKTLRAKTFLQFETHRPFGFPDHTPDLPREYYQDKLVLMPKDPEWMFSYWELTSDLVERKSQEKRDATETYREVLKINWDSRDLFETNFTFIPVHFMERKWWFKVPDSGQTYQIELGWLSDNGHFISIIASEASELPETWRKTQRRLENENILLRGGSRTMHFGSSEHFILEGNGAFMDFFNPSSDIFSSSSRMTKAPETDWSGRRGPIPAELEIKGKVRPGTAVKVDDRNVVTDADGYFRILLPVEKNNINMTLTSRSGMTESFLYNLKELTVC